jgi:hypothetical protein
MRKMICTMVLIMLSLWGFTQTGDSFLTKKNVTS